ncbi:MAG: delta-60 repeat domain-containing protein [Verrucomicrobiota bacterium]
MNPSSFFNRHPLGRRLGRLEAYFLAMLLTSGLKTSVLAQFSGSLDATFDPNLGSVAVPWANTVAYAAVSLTNGQCIIGGNFTTYDDSSVGRLARLNADGTLDTTFNSSGTGVDLGAYPDPSGVFPNATRLLPNGQIYIGGPFEGYNGVTREGSARINADGTLDLSYDPGTGGGSPGGSGKRTLCLYPQPNGQVIVGGDFTTFQGAAHSKIARLNSNGSLDATFNANADSTVRDVLVLPNGQIMMCGQFTTVNGTGINRLARLNSDGTLDGTFNAGTGIAGTLAYVMTLQPDGKLLVGGLFNTYNNQPATNIFRINADGTRDTSFNTGGGVNNQVSSILVQPDGKILIGGNFTSVDGFPLTGVARLNADGSVDKTFDSGKGAAFGSVYHFALQQGNTNLFGGVTNKVVIVGEFSTYNLETQNHVARVIAGDNIALALVTAPPSSPTLTLTRAGNSVVISWPVSAVGFTLQQEGALDNSWSNVGTPVVVVGSLNTVTVPIGAGPVFFRLKY